MRSLHHEIPWGGQDNWLSSNQNKRLSSYSYEAAFTAKLHIRVSQLYLGWHKTARMSRDQGSMNWYIYSTYSRLLCIDDTDTPPSPLPEPGRPAWALSTLGLTASLAQGTGLNANTKGNESISTMGANAAVLQPQQALTTHTLCDDVP